MNIKQIFFHRAIVYVLVIVTMSVVYLLTRYENMPNSTADGDSHELTYFNDRPITSFRVMYLKLLADGASDAITLKDRIMSDVTEDRIATVLKWWATLSTDRGSIVATLPRRVTGVNDRNLWTISMDAIDLHFKTDFNKLANYEWERFGGLLYVTPFECERGYEEMGDSKYLMNAGKLGRVSMDKFAPGWESKVTTSGAAFLMKGKGPFQSTGYQNVAALRYWQKQGYDLSKLHLNNLGRFVFLTDVARRWMANKEFFKDGVKESVTIEDFVYAVNSSKAQTQGRLNVSDDEILNAIVEVSKNPITYPNSTGYGWFTRVERGNVMNGATIGPIVNKLAVGEKYHRPAKHPYTCVYVRQEEVSRSEDDLAGYSNMYTKLPHTNKYIMKSSWQSVLTPEQFRKYRDMDPGTAKKTGLIAAVCWLTMPRTPALQNWDGLPTNSVGIKMFHKKDILAKTLKVGAHATYSVGKFEDMSDKKAKSIVKNFL